MVQDIFLTETAMFADVILPASAWPEKDGTFTNTNRQVQMGRKALDAPGEARQDWWIIQEIARRIGLDWNYDGPADVFAEMKQAMPSLDNITWERPGARERGHLSVRCAGPAGQRHRLRRPASRRRAAARKFVPADIVPPDEQPDDDYPMVLTTGRQLEHWHTGAMTRRSFVLDAIEPEAVAQLSTADLAAAGPRAPKARNHWSGSRPAAAPSSSRRGPTGATCPRAWSSSPSPIAEAAANELTNPVLDPFGKIPEFKFCAARHARSRSAPSPRSPVPSGTAPR